MNLHEAIRRTVFKELRRYATPTGYAYGVESDDLIQEAWVNVLARAQGNIKYVTAQAVWTVRQKFRDERLRAMGQVEDHLSAPCPSVDIDNRDMVDWLLAGLDDGDREIVEAYMHGVPQTVLAAKRGVTQQCIALKFKSILDKLKRKCYNANQ